MQDKDQEVQLRNFELLTNSYSSKSAFARAAGMTQSNVSQILNGHRKLNGNILRRVEHNLRLPPGWFDVEQVIPPRVHAVTENFVAYEKYIPRGLLQDDPETFEERIAEELFRLPGVFVQSAKTVHTKLGPYTPDFFVTKNDKTVAVEVKKANHHRSKDSLLAAAVRCDMAHIPFFVLATDEDPKTYEFLEAMREHHLLEGFQGVTGELRLDVLEFIRKI